MYRRSSIAPRISFSYFPHVSVDFHTFFQVIAANQMIERRDLTCYIKWPVAYDRHHSLADAPLVSICSASVFYCGLLSFCSPTLLLTFVICIMGVVDYVNDSGLQVKVSMACN